MQNSHTQSSCTLKIILIVNAITIIIFVLIIRDAIVVIVSIKVIINTISVCFMI